MSLPQYINHYSDNFYAYENFIQDLNTTYIFSLKETSGLSEKTSNIALKDDVSLTNLEGYSPFVEFDREAYEKIRSDSAALISSKSANVCKYFRNSILEYHVRNAVQFAFNSTEKLYNPLCLRSDIHLNLDPLREIALAPWTFDKLPGNNPQNWPTGLEELLEKLHNLPPLTLFNEPFELNKNFKVKSKDFVKNCASKIKANINSIGPQSQDVINLINALRAIFGITYHTGSFIEIMEGIELINEVHNILGDDVSTKIAPLIDSCLYPIIQKIGVFARESMNFHHIQSLCDEGGFKISRVAHFQKQTFQTTTITTDGAYLYILVNAVNGGMYKVGTGEKNTIPGKIYLYTGVNKSEEVCWIYLKGKLYLRNSSREFGALEIICPNTFKLDGLLQVYCPEIFGHPSLQIINKNYPLLTDGEYLYIIGKKLLSEKIGAEKKDDEKTKIIEKKEEIIGQIPNIQQQEQQKQEQGNANGIQQNLDNKESPSEENKELAIEKKADSPKKEDPAAISSGEKLNEGVIEKKESIEAKKEDEQKKEEFIQNNNGDSQKNQNENSIGQDKEVILPVAENEKKDNISDKKEPSNEKGIEIKDDKKDVPNENKESSLEKKEVSDEKKEIISPEKKENPEIKKADIPEKSDGLSEKKEENSEKKDEVHADKNNSGQPNPQSLNQPQAQAQSQGSSNKPQNQNQNQANKDKEAQAKLIDKKLSREKKKNDQKKNQLDTALDAEHTMKLCEYFLYEFDVNNTKGLDLSDKGDIQDASLVQELYESFSGYFTFNECARALNYNKDDIQNAAQWLVDEGEKERSKKTVTVRNATLLAQSEVTSDISSKQLKTGNEIQTKEDSIIFPNNVSNNIWTMNRTHLALYSEVGVKIFSKNPNDVHDINNELKSNTNINNSMPTQQFVFEVISPNFGQGKVTNSYGLFGSYPPNNGLFGSNHNPSNGLFENKTTYQMASGMLNTNDNLYEGFAPDKTIVWNPLILSNTNQTIFGSAKNKPLENQTSISSNGSILQNAKDDPIGTGIIVDPAELLASQKSAKKKETSDGKEKENEKPKIILKGTYIRTIDSKKVYYSNPSFHICYDPYFKKFYTFTWIWNSHSNVFPSLVTVSYDHERYEENALHTFPIVFTQDYKLKNIRDVASRLMIEMMKVQSKRFSLPWRLRNWDYLYGWILNDLTNKKSILGTNNNNGTDNDEEKKKFQNQKAKLIQRLGKIRNYLDSKDSKQLSNPIKPKNVKIQKSKKSDQSSNNKDHQQQEKIMTIDNFSPLAKTLREIRKDYAYCIDGSLETFSILTNLIKSTGENFLEHLNKGVFLDKQDFNSFFSYFYMIFYWAKHSDITLTYKENTPNEITYFENFLFKFLSSEYLTQANLINHQDYKTIALLGWRIAINSFEILIRTSKKIFKWMGLMLQKSKLFENEIFKEDIEPEYEWLNRDGLSPLIYFYLKFAYLPDSMNFEFPLRDYQIENIKAPETNTTQSEEKNNDYCAFLKRSQIVKLKEINMIEPLGRLLITNLNYLEYVKAYDYQFEDLYPAYFIEENIDTWKQEKLKSEKEQSQQIKDKTAKDGDKIQRDKKPILEKDIKTKKDLANQASKADDDSNNKNNNAKVNNQPSNVKKIIIEESIKQIHKELSNKLWAQFETELCAIINNLNAENILMWKIFLKLILDSWIEFEKIEEEENEWRFKLEFIENVINSLEKILDHYSSMFNDVANHHLRNSIFLPKLFQNISLLISSISYLVYQSNITKNFGCEELGYSLIKLNEKLREILRFGSNINILDQIIHMHSEGIDHLNEKVLETNHPYERGKVINFEQINFPDAIAISIEFDRRCQSDTTQDFIALLSWHDNHLSNLGFYMNHRDFVGSSFRISGKPGIKKPLVMLGNNLQVDFTSSMQAKDEHSLNRWGFKLKIKPIFGLGNFMLKDQANSTILNEVQNKFGGEKGFKDYLTALSLLNLTIVEIVELHIKGNYLTQQEKNNNHFLKWHLLKNGISSVDLNTYLAKSDDGFYKSIQKLEYLDTEGRVFDDSFENLKESIYTRISKFRPQKDVAESYLTKQQQSTLLALNDPIIAAFVQDIKDQRGEFVDFIREMRLISPEPQNLKNEKKRPTFKSELKKLWEQAEMLIVLSLLHHSGLLKFLLNGKNKVEFPKEPMIQEQLIVIGSKRNEILCGMLNQVQSEREWQQTLDEISELRNKYLTEKCLEEAKKAFEEEEKKLKADEEKKKKDESTNSVKQTQPSNPNAGDKNKSKESNAKQIPGSNMANVEKTLKKIKESGKPVKKESKITIRPKKSVPKSKRINQENNNDSSDEEAKKESESEEENKSDNENKDDTKTDGNKTSSLKKILDFDEKLDEQVSKHLSKRLEGDSTALKMLCSLKDIDINKDPNDIIKEIYEACKDALLLCKKDPKTQNYQLDFKSPYEIIANQIIAKSTFLLKLSKNLLKEDSHSSAPSSIPSDLFNIDEEDSLKGSIDQDEKLRPLQLARSFSSSVESQIRDLNQKARIENLRELIDTYSKWKEWHKKDIKENEDYLCSDTASPLKSVVAFLTSRANPTEVELCLQNQITRSTQRIIGFQMVNKLLDSILNTPLEKYLMGVFTQVFSEDYLTNITCIPQQFKDVLNDNLMQIALKLIDSFNKKVDIFRGIKLKALNSMMNRIKAGSSTTNVSTLESLTQQYLVLMSCNLREIATLLSDRKTLKKFLQQENQATYEKISMFFQNIIDIAMLCNCFLYLSLNFENILLISQNFIQNCTNLILNVSSLNITKGSGLFLRILTDALKREIGLSIDSDGHSKLNARILHRLNDILSIEKLNYLMNVTHEILSRKNLMKRHDNLTNELAFVLINLIYHHNAPSILRNATKNLRLIIDQLKILKNTPYDVFYYLLQHPEYDHLMKTLRNQGITAINAINTNDLIVREIPASLPDSHLEINKMTNFISLLEKLGSLILNSNKTNNASTSSQNDLTFKSLIDNDNLLSYIPNKNPKSIVVMHLANEEDLSYLVRVFYYWEELYPTFIHKLPTTIEEYQQFKENLSKKEAENRNKSNSVSGSASDKPAQQVGNLAERFRIYEKMFVNLPEINLIAKSEEELPIGWIFNMLGNYIDCKIHKTEYKKSKIKKTVKKAWVNANLNKLDKKYEELAKSFEEFKETDSDEDKLQNILARNFITRMHQHVKDAYCISTMLNVFGFAPIFDGLPNDKAMQLAHLINLGLNGLLKPIPVDQFKKEDLRKKLDPTIIIPEKQPSQSQVNATGVQKSAMFLSICDASILSVFEANFDFISNLNPSKESFFIDSNKVTVIHKSVKSGHATGMAINELINFLREILHDQQFAQEVMPFIQNVFSKLASKRDLTLKDVSQFDKEIIIAICAVIGGWTDNLRVGSDVKLKTASGKNNSTNNTSFSGMVSATASSPSTIAATATGASTGGSNAICMLHGGSVSGKKTFSVINKNDFNLNVLSLPQNTLYSELNTPLPNELLKLDPKSIINSLAVLHEIYKQTTTETEDYILISSLVRSLLRVTSTISWIDLLIEKQEIINAEDLKQLTEIILSISQNCPVDRSYHYYENAFGEAWERYIDKKEERNHLYFFPQKFKPSSAITSTGKLYEFETNTNKEVTTVTTKADQSKIIDASALTQDTVLPSSTYISSLPEYQPLVSEHKMLKYWEKHIIPKIQDFVRSSYKPWEFEDYFEQLRQPLRKGDQAKAAEIAYIICDQRLPNGVTLPDANHDWSTISVEEIVLGTWAIASIANKQNKIFSPFFQSQKKLANNDVCVQILAVDNRSSSVLVLYYDHDNIQMVTIWLPVTCLKTPEIPMQPPASYFLIEHIIKNYKLCAENSIALLARKTLLKFFRFQSMKNQQERIEQMKKESELTNNIQLELVKVITWSVLDELGEDPVEGWLTANGMQIEDESHIIKPQSMITSTADIFKYAVNTVDRNEKATPKLYALQSYMNWMAKYEDHKNNTSTTTLLLWLEQEFNKVVKFINTNSASVDLQKPYIIQNTDNNASSSNNHAPSNVYYMNKCFGETQNDDSISAISLTFKKESTLCLCAGLKFFSDPMGINVIQHVQAGKENRTKLPSLIFKQSNVWFSYYFNAEALPPYMQSQTSILHSIIHAVPSMWSVCFWVADALSTSFMLSKKMSTYKQLCELLRVISDAMSKFKGPLNLKYLLYKLLNRTLKKLRILADSLPEFENIRNLDPESMAKEHFSILNISKAQMQGIIEEAKKLKDLQSNELGILYSSYTQEVSEYIANCFVPLSLCKKNNLLNTKVFIEYNLPDWVIAVVNSALFLQNLKGENNLTDDLNREILSSVRLDPQWDRILYIENLPLEWSKNYIKNELKAIVLKNNARILNPVLDINILNGEKETLNGHIGKCIVLFDGWSSFDLEDEPEKKMIEEPKEEEAIIEPEIWICEACTFENKFSNPLCEICEGPKPAIVKKPETEVIEDIKHTDLSELDQKMQQKEREKLEKLACDINKWISTYYEEQKAKLKILQDAEKVEREKLLKLSQNKDEKKEEKVELKSPDLIKLEKEAKAKKNRELKNLKKEKKLKALEEEREKRKLNKLKAKGLIPQNLNEESKLEVESQPKEEEKPKQIESTIKENIKSETDQPILEKKDDKPVVVVDEVKPTTEQKPEEMIQKLSSPELEKIVQEKIEIEKNLLLEKKGIICNGLKAIQDKQEAKQYLNEFLCNRLLDSNTNEYKSAAYKILIRLFNSLKQNMEYINEQYKKSIQIIDLNNLHDTTEKDFIEKTLENIKKNNNALGLWKLLEYYGYDLWFNEASFNNLLTFSGYKMPPLRILEQIITFVQIDLCKENKSVLNYPPNNIRVPVSQHNSESEDKAIGYELDNALFNLKYPHAAKYMLRDIRFSWAFIKIFNKYLSNAIPYINTVAAINYDINSKWLNLGTYITAYRNLWMMPIKIELSQKIMQKTAIARDHVPKVTLERLKLSKERETHAKKFNNIYQAFNTKEIASYKNKDEFIFTKAHEQLKDISTTLFRPGKPGGTDPFLAFEIIFKGELVMGEAGPYRQFFADISSELQPNSVSLITTHKNLNLLCPSPNNYSRIGEARDKFVINPSAKSPYQLQLFEFLGILMGCSIRTGTHLTLDLPSIFWKQLVHQPILIEDLEEIDKPLTDLIKFMTECTKDVFEESIFENYSTMLSDKSIVELKPAGLKIRVRFEDRFDYISKVLEVRIKESKLQIDAIRKGMTQLAPLPFLNVVSAKDVEIWVCGKSKVDIDLLKRHTRYSGGLNEDSARVKYLWEVLKDLNDNEKLRFVKFCWGQERLPANDEEFERTHTRFMIKPAQYANSERGLPKADTCFFNLELPNYSSKQTLKEKILTAINFDCDSMNAEELINLDPNAQHHHDRGDSDIEESEDEQ